MIDTIVTVLTAIIIWLRKYQKEITDAKRELDLLVPLTRTLLPLKEDMDRMSANIDGRHAVVKIAEFPEQHAFGITRCCGFIIDWK